LIGEKERRSDHQISAKRTDPFQASKNQKEDGGKDCQEKYSIEGVLTSKKAKGRK